jgi:ABC-type bacteriocin/lantibiotic exporter with double-glycine peptidase domain
VLVFALVIGLLTLATPIAVETLVNTVAFGRFLQPVVILSLMLLTFLAFSGAIRGLQTYVVEIIQRRLFARVAADLAYRLPRVRPESLDGRSGRELVNRFFDVVVVQKVAAQLLLDGVLLVLGTLIGMALLAFYHPWLLGFDVMLLGMIALIVFVLGRGAIGSSVKESKTKYHMAAWLEELAGCPTTFRYDGSARLALEHADRLTSDYLAARAKHFRILMRQIVFALAMQALASTVLLGLGGWLVISGQLTLGQLVAAELIVAVIVGSFAKLGKHMESFYDLLASVDKLGLLFDLPLERQDGLISLPSEARDVVELTEVEYCHPDGQPVLRDFNLTIQPGDRVAITGPAGSGKSSLLDILFGLRIPTGGHVTMSGVELRELRPDALRRRVALVRETEVFMGSVAENVRLGRSSISTDDVRKSLADVGLLEDVLRLPQRLDTQLVGSGHPLTSTQLLRLMLARGCAGKPGLLLIDGTLDSLSDREALALVQWLCRSEHPWKLVMVTGREALAAACDRRIELQRLSASSESRQRMPEDDNHE